MKTSIPSDVWEKKKALIARLYKDEEWPLKQVIKQIRTEDFNPSETQLRSRLKKWRVTKPSRQTRKKPVDGPGENDDEEDDGRDEMSPAEPKHTPLQSSTPQSQSQLSHVDASSVGRDWYPSQTWTQPPLSQQQSQPETTPQGVPADLAVTSTWTAPVSAAPQLSMTTERHVPQQQNPASQISTPVVSQFSPNVLSATYDTSQQSPRTTVSSSHMVSPSYVASYPMAQMAYPQPAPPTAVQWPTGSDYIEPDVAQPGMSIPPTNWFTAQYEANSGAPHPALYQRATDQMTNSYAHLMQPMAPQGMGSPYQPQQQFQPQPHPQMAGYQSPEENAAIRPWRRAVASQFHPEVAPGYVRVDRQGRQRKPIMDRKHKEMPEEMNMSLQQTPQMQPVQSVHHTMQTVMPPQYVAAGHHSLMPHDIYTYAGHEQLLQRPIGH